MNDWIGLGSMDYYGIGFSNIRLPNDSESYIYKYNKRINTFPEEVFMHEYFFWKCVDSFVIFVNITKESTHFQKKYLCMNFCIL